MKLYSDRPTEVSIRDSTYLVNGKSVIYVERLKEPLIIKATQDSVSKEYTFKPKPSTAFYFNVFVGYGAGFLIDFLAHEEMEKGKMNGYRSLLYLDVNSKLKQRISPGVKGRLDFHFSYPFHTFFLFQVPNSTVNSNGHTGIITGLEYYFKKGKSIQVNVSSLNRMQTLFNSNDYFESFNSKSISVTRNIKYRGLTFGVGVNYSENTWKANSYDYGFLGGDLTEYSLSTYKSKTVGFTLNAYLQLTESFKVGGAYQNSYYKLDQEIQTGFDHIFSLDFGWKINTNEKWSNQ